MSGKRNMFYSALALTLVNLLLRLVSTTFQVFLSGRLGAAGIGLLQLVMSVGSLAMTVGMAGIRTATMYLTAEELGKGRPGNAGWILRGCAVYALVCGITVGLCLYLGAPWIAEFWIGYPETLEPVRLYALFLPLVCLCGCMTGYFTAANRIGTLAAVEIGEQAISMAVTFGALHFWAGSDPEKACQCVILGSGIGACVTVFALVFLKSRQNPVAPTPIPMWNRLFRTAIPLALGDDLKIGINTLENLMVPKRLAKFTGSVSPLADFGLVCGMVFPILMFPACILYALAELLIPELARCAAIGSKTRIQYLSARSLRIALLYGCLCGGLLYLLAQPLCVTLYGSEDAGYHLTLYALLAPMLYCDAITDAINKGLGQQAIAVRYNILTAVLDVVGLYLLLPRYGILGYYISFLISHLLNFLLSLRLLCKTSGIRIPLYIPALTLSAAVAGVLVADFAGSVFWRILGYCGIFGSLLTLFGIISKEDLYWLRGLVAKK